MESWVLESGIQLKEFGIQVLRTDKYWNPVPGIPNPQRGIQNRRLSIPLHGAYCVHPPPSLVQVIRIRAAGQSHVYAIKIW